VATAELITDNNGKERIAVKIHLREKSLIKQVPGARYDAELGVWTTRKAYTACVQLSNIFRNALEVSTELKEYAQGEYTKTIAQRERGLLLDAELQHWREGEMSPLQRVGAGFLAGAESAILADEMGAGKTVQATVAVDIVIMLNDIATLNERFHGLAVVPNSTKRGWARHIDEWTLSVRPYVLKGNKKQRLEIIEAFKADKRAMLIANWEQLRAHSRLAPYGNIRLTDEERTPKEFNDFEFDVIIADEAHRAKNASSKQTRGLWAPKAKRKWAMTGTPIANHPGDLWSILHFIDPDEWPSRSAYIDRYCLTQWNVHGGMDIVGIRYDTRDEFYHLIDRYFLRRLKRDIMGRDIVKVPEVRYVELPPKHRKMYKEFKEELLLMLENGAISATNPLAATSRLVQLSAAPLDMTDEGKYVMVKPSPKVAELLSLVEAVEEPVVVFSASKQLLYLAAEELEKKGIPYLFASGDQGEDERAEAVERFQAGEGTVFLATQGAMSEGVTLTRAKVLCFLQRDWSMVKNKQAEDRIHRWGQEADSVTIVDIITEDTIDERVYEVFTTKEGRLDEVTRDSWKELL